MQAGVQQADALRLQVPYQQRMSWLGRHAAEQLLVAVQGRVASAAQQAGALSTQVLDQQQRLTEQEQQLAQSAAQARADSQTLAAERQRAAHQAETLQSSLAEAERRAEEADAALVALQRRLEEVSAEQQVECRCSMLGAGSTFGTAQTCMENCVGWGL